jgi:hypothetical protein
VVDWLHCCWACGEAVHRGGERIVEQSSITSGQVEHKDRERG